MEAEEISEFAKEMREAGKASMTRVSLIISVLAVFVALLTVLGHREHTEAVLAQARASDRWSEYQGRRIRQAQLLLASDLIRMQLPQGNSNSQGVDSAHYTAAAARIQEQLDEDTKEARKLEQEVGIAERKATRLDVGEALLQISVVLASITLITRRWWYVLTALGLGMVGLVTAACSMLVR